MAGVLRRLGVAVTTAVHGGDAVGVWVRAAASAAAAAAGGGAPALADVDSVVAAVSARTPPTLDAATAAAVAALLSRSPPAFDFACIDNLMPVLSGRATTARLRALGVPATVPVVIITGDALTEDDDGGLDLAGASLVLAKPIDVGILRAGLAALGLE